MNYKTYLQESFKNGQLMRWTYMPLVVFIAPMNFYSKQGQDYKYKNMVIKALEVWQKAAAGQIQIQLTDDLLSSNVNVEWRRVDRKALGHCLFNYDTQNRLYSAEVSIGLSDGVIHQQYMADGEVYHTILHEIGHALGLGHSPYKSDIMYTPHQYGMVNLSQNDAASIQWLYRLPQGASVSQIAAKYGVGGSHIDEVIQRVLEKGYKSEFEKVKDSVIMQPKKDLLQEQTNIGDLKKYNLTLQNIQLSPKVSSYLTGRKIENDTKCEEDDQK